MDPVSRPRPSGSSGRWPIAESSIRRSLAAGHDGTQRGRTPLCVRTADAFAPTMTTGISLDDGTGAARRISMTGNRCLHGVTTPLAHLPADPRILVGEPPRVERPEATAPAAPP